ncbi:hypothetical protein SBOR_1715 [Sclerotinia borealis F-4128]|uniref:Uncharacterized protein n=1 Tax=Sclerotinia borealis (strain F-4128) TaxID=1432307 RepID=W9CPE1_SCLBF|nr:hypothetical protein SBOR_1715 [Sclerotinia borealis F-4128]
MAQFPPPPPPPRPQRRQTDPSALLPSFMATGTLAITHRRQLEQSELSLTRSTTSQPVQVPVQVQVQVQAEVQSLHQPLHPQQYFTPLDFASPPAPTPQGLPALPLPTPQLAPSLPPRRGRARTRARTTPPRRRRRPRAEEFAPAAATAPTPTTTPSEPTSSTTTFASTIATVRAASAAWVTDKRRDRKKRRVIHAHETQGHDFDMMLDWQHELDAMSVLTTEEDWYGMMRRGQGHGREMEPEEKMGKGGNVSGDDDEYFDADDDGEEEEEKGEEVPAEPTFQVSERWRQRGAAGLAKARWASQRYQAKKRVRKTATWLVATPERRNRMELEAADAIPFIADATPVGPVPPRSMEPWLRSERETLLRIIDSRNRTTHLDNKLDLVTSAYNRRISGTLQRCGEYCVAIGNGQSRRDSQLTEDRTAPVRTQISINANMRKWIERGDVCECRQHQRYLEGDFERSGGFPGGHAVERCVEGEGGEAEEDSCFCGNYLRDYNGGFEEGHGERYCSASRQG